MNGEMGLSIEHFNRFQRKEAQWRGRLIGELANDDERRRKERDSDESKATTAKNQRGQGRDSDRNEWRMD